MIKKRKLSKHITDVAWGELRRQLEYKSKRKGKTLIKTDRWLPSSQMCSNCLSLTGKKPLNVRKFTCPVCGTAHDRDINAAKIIEYFGLLTLGRNTRGEPPSGDGDSISIVTPSSYGSMKREASAS